MAVAEGDCKSQGVRVKGLRPGGRDDGIDGCETIMLQDIARSTVYVYPK